MNMKCVLSLELLHSVEGKLRRGCHSSESNPDILHSERGRIDRDVKCARYNGDVIFATLSLFVNSEELVLKYKTSASPASPLFSSLPFDLKLRVFSETPKLWRRNTWHFWSEQPS